MSIHTVILGPSGDCGWAQVRLTLSELGVEVVAEATQLDRLLHLTRSLCPSLVVTAGELDQPIVPTLSLMVAQQRLETRVAVVFRESQRESIEWSRSSGPLWAASWDGLTDRTLRTLLELALGGDLVVLDRDVSRAMVNPLGKPGPGERYDVSWRDRDVEVFGRLLAGFTLGETARECSLSLRTISRVVSDVASSLDASGPIQLGARAILSGLQPFGD